MGTIPVGMFHVEHCAVGRVYYPSIPHLVYAVNQTVARSLFTLFHRLSYLALVVVPSLSAPVRLGACFSGLSWLLCPLCIARRCWDLWLFCRLGFPRMGQFVVTCGQNFALLCSVTRTKHHTMKAVLSNVNGWDIVERSMWVNDQGERCSPYGTHPERGTGWRIERTGGYLLQNRHNGCVFGRPSGGAYDTVEDAAKAANERYASILSPGD